MSDANEQGDTYLLWRLQIPGKYRAIAYLSSEICFRSCLPTASCFDKATFGPVRVEDSENSFYVHFFPQVDGDAERIGDVNTLMEGIRMAEAHWTSQRI